MRLQLSVEDSGIGIPQECMIHLFKPFSQLDPSETRSYEGSGLGLAIAKQLVQLMGGDIWAESDGQNCGAKFNFFIQTNFVSETSVNTMPGDATTSVESSWSLPSVSRPITPDRNWNTSLANEIPLKILVVEDNP